MKEFITHQSMIDHLFILILEIIFQAIGSIHDVKCFPLIYGVKVDRHWLCIRLRVWVPCLCNIVSYTYV
jgi:hypothetical protein